ncbi:hypothetical protein CBM2589_A91084 [Cupriavidus taiwanensis]|uniref:Uncharacterized protein n=1 Tax=Cupriavidus taiwanensis TaxID=164546 RepID=A0A375CH81_9BURK|nr:hypothetical protein CBM2589_A91084 [Cupriavidus taiwanensis]
MGWPDTVSCPAFFFCGERGVTFLTASRNTLRRDPPVRGNTPCAVLAGPPSSVREAVKTPVPTHFASRRRLTMEQSKTIKTLK